MADLGAGAALQAQPTRPQLWLHGFGQHTQEEKKKLESGGSMQAWERLHARKMWKSSP